MTYTINPLNAKLNPICHLLALLEAHHILHVSKIRVNFIIYVPSVFCEECPFFGLPVSPVSFSVSPLLFRPLKLNSLKLEVRFNFTVVYLYKAHSWPWLSSSGSPTYRTDRFANSTCARCRCINPVTGLSAHDRLLLAI